MKMIMAPDWYTMRGKVREINDGVRRGTGYCSRDCEKRDDEIAPDPRTTRLIR